MHITLETDYAIRIVDLLARSKAVQIDGKSVCSRMDAKTISEKTGVPLRFSLKILRKLVGGQIVRSFKGIYGGYELVKSPSEISLYDVVEIAEGDYRFSRCLDAEYDCSNKNAERPPCAYRKVFGEISEIVRSELKQRTFDNLFNEE